jgi:hypothetical protein
MTSRHETQDSLAAQIAAAEQLVSIGGLYCHFKSESKAYKVLGIGVEEADTSLSVIYQAQYDDCITYIRPLTSWLQTVEYGGQFVQRFTEIRGE